MPKSAVIYENGSMVASFVKQGSLSGRVTIFEREFSAENMQHVPAKSMDIEGHQAIERLYEFLGECLNEMQKKELFLDYHDDVDSPF